MSRNKILFTIILQSFVIVGMAWILFSGNSHQVTNDLATTSELKQSDSYSEYERTHKRPAITDEAGASETMASDSEKVADYQKQEAPVEQSPLTIELQQESYNNANDIIDQAIYRGSWGEAEFLALMESAPNLTPEMQFELVNKIGSAINRQELAIVDPRFIPML